MIEKKTQQAKHIRAGDKVMVITGNERGKIGKVLSRTDDKVVVQGLNIRKKHVKPSQLNPRGGTIEFEGAIHASNVQVVTEDDQPRKLKVRFNAAGERELYYVQDKQQVLYRPIKKSK